MLFSLAACSAAPVSSREPAVARDAVEVDPRLVTAVPIPIFHAVSLSYEGRVLKPYVLKHGEFVFVHSARTLWSPRVSGQAFFDTFLFGCEDLPPSPLDRVTNEGHLMQIGEGALIEEYPDHVATFDDQPVAWIRCE